jgi:cytochrome c peroxidase
MRAALAAAICVGAIWTPLPAADPASDGGYAWTLPKGFPKPRVPADNPMTAAKVELGRHLFYDVRMSVNAKASCATCHRQELAFTDGKPVGVGATGEKHPRGAMSLVNVAYSGRLTWNNPEMRRLEDQALVPMFGEHPVELGLREGDGLLPMLRSDARYRGLFAQAFPGETDPFSVANVVKAIASFERSIISGRSPWDRYHYERDDAAISESAKRGEILFFDSRLSCFRCHGGFNFSGGEEFHNTGVSTGDPGKFKAPSLRNIAVTAPYMHDGSMATLDAVLDHYSSGGKESVGKDPLIHGFKLSQEDRQDLIAFLQSLTDDAVLHDARFANPW